MCTFVVHVLLLFINLSQRFKPKLLLRGKFQAGLQHGINDRKVSVQILELLVDGFTRLLFGVLAVAHIPETVPVCFIAIGSGLLFHALLLQRINDLLGIFARLIQKRHILRKADIGRCTGRIHDQCAAVVATCGRIGIIVILILFGFLLLPFFCIPQDHLVDLAQHFRRQTLAEVHHERRVKRQMLIVIAGTTAEVLQIRILLYL